MDEAGNLIWPQDTEGRQKMARALLGIELVSNVDYWLLLAQDELDDTYEAPWASPDKKPRPEEVQRREVFRTLSPEQRRAVRDLLHRAVKGELYSFCIALDRTLGGSTVSIDSPVKGDTDERLVVHSPDQEELHIEQHEWLEDFSILFEQDERHESEV